MVTESLLRAADIIDDAVDRTVETGTVTPDMGGSATTSGFTDAAVAAISAT